MRENSARYFSNRSCVYYPCHKTADEENFNCLFCYCPLYVLGDRCGGSFQYTKEGTKDCAACMIPHCDGGYEHVMAHIKEVCALVSQKP